MSGGGGGFCTPSLSSTGCSSSTSAAVWKPARVKRRIAIIVPQNLPSCRGTRTRRGELLAVRRRQRERVEIARSHGGNCSVLRRCQNASNRNRQTKREPRRLGGKRCAAHRIVHFFFFLLEAEAARDAAFSDAESAGPDALCEPLSRPVQCKNQAEQALLGTNADCMFCSSGAALRQRYTSKSAGPCASESDSRRARMLFI